MKKAFIMMGVAALVSGGAWLMPANAECVDTDLGSACAEENRIVLDGAETNEDPLDGYITVSDAGVCAQDEGGPDDEDADPNCNEEIVTSQLG